MFLPIQPTMHLQPVKLNSKEKRPPPPPQGLILPPNLLVHANLCLPQQLKVSTFLLIKEFGQVYQAFTSLASRLSASVSSPKLSCFGYEWSYTSQDWYVFYSYYVGDGWLHESPIVASYFDTHRDGRIKWYAAPPLDIVQDEPALPSLDYLVYNRSRKDEGTDDVGILNESSKSFVLSEILTAET